MPRLSTTRDRWALNPGFRLLRRATMCVTYSQTHTLKHTLKCSDPHSPIVGHINTSITLLRLLNKQTEEIHYFCHYQQWFQTHSSISTGEQKEEQYFACVTRLCDAKIWKGKFALALWGKPKLCHLFARSRGFIEYSYEFFLNRGKRNQSISWLPVAQLLKTVLFLGFDLKQQPSLLTSQMWTQMLPLQ